jgi:CBS domain-containing protein
MTQSVREFMTAQPIVLASDQSMADAARAMRDHGIGVVLVADGISLAGLVTDRDLVVRGLATGGGPETPLGEVCSASVLAVNADDDAAEALRIMRENAVRRLPVLHDGQITGIVSLGDLAIAEERGSTLADISTAPPNT